MRAKKLPLFSLFINLCYIKFCLIFQYFEMSHHKKSAHSVKDITFMVERQKMAGKKFDFIKHFRVPRLVTYLKTFSKFLARIFLRVFL